MRADLIYRMRLAPSALPLLAYLCGCLPTVYSLGAAGHAAGVGVLLGVLCAVPPRWRVALACVYLGALLRSSWVVDGSSNTYREHLAREDCHGTVRGVVLDEPSSSGRTVRFRLAVESAGGQGRAVPCGGEVMVSLDSGSGGSSAAIPVYGAMVTLDGCFTRIDVRSGYGCHLRSLGLEHVFHACRAEIESGPKGWRLLMGRFLSCRRSLGRLLAAGMPQETGNLYQSMMFGLKELFPTETRRQFLRAAFLHVFAISGLHIMTIFRSVMTVVPRLGFGLVFSVSWCCVFSLGYVLLTGVTPSALRALTMILLLGLSKMLRRGRNVGHTLCLAALVELTLNPLSLYGTGFLFSYIIVLALVYGDSLVSAAKEIVFESMRWKPSIRRRSRLERFQTRLAEHAGGLVLAWAASVPLSMHLNGILPFGALLLGLLVQYVALWLVKGALLKICLSGLLPCVSGLTGAVTDTLMRLLAFLAELGAGEGVAMLRAQESGVCAAVVLCSVFAVIVGWRSVWLRRVGAWVFILWLAACILDIRSGAPSLFIGLGADGGVPALGIVHENRQAEVLCSGSRAGAAELRDALIRHGIEDVRFMPVIPQAELLSGALCLMRFRTPRMAAIPNNDRASGDFHRLQAECEAAGTAIRRANQDQAGVWRYGQDDGTALEYHARNNVCSMRFRRKGVEVRLDRLDSGLRVITARYPGGGFSRVLKPTAPGGTEVLALTPPGRLKVWSGLYELTP